MTQNTLSHLRETTRNQHFTRTLDELDTSTRWKRHLHICSTTRLARRRQQVNGLAPHPETSVAKPRLRGIHLKWIPNSGLSPSSTWKFAQTTLITSDRNVFHLQVRFAPTCFWLVVLKKNLHKLVRYNHVLVSPDFQRSVRK